MGRLIQCDLCGKIVDFSKAFDEDGHTTEDGYVNVEIRDSRDYGNEYYLCVTCYKRIFNFADTNLVRR